MHLRLLLLPVGGGHVHLGLELESEGLLEVDRPDGLVLVDLGSPDLTIGHGEHDGLLKDRLELLADLELEQSL